jgi:hypothetical protein
MHFEALAQSISKGGLLQGSFNVNVNSFDVLRADKMIVQCDGCLRLKIIRERCERIFGVPQISNQIAPAPFIVEKANASTLKFAHANRTVKSMPKHLTTQNVSVNIGEIITRHGELGSGKKVAH